MIFKKTGFSLVKAFFKKNSKDVIDDSQHYRSRISKNRFVAVIDENMRSHLFKSLYVDCLDNKDDLISFFARKPAKVRNPYRLRNFTFLQSRPDDRILRLSSGIIKSPNHVAGSLLYHWVGLDAYSFRTVARNTPTSAHFEAEVLVGFRYIPLSKAPSLVCAITGKDLQQSVRDFAQNNNSLVPISVYNIVTLNKQFRTLSRKYTVAKLQKILTNANLI